MQRAGEGQGGAPGGSRVVCGERATHRLTPSVWLSQEGLLSWEGLDMTLTTAHLYR